MADAIDDPCRLALRQIALVPVSPVRRLALIAHHAHAHVSAAADGGACLVLLETLFFHRIFFFFLVRALLGKRRRPSACLQGAPRCPC